MKKIYRAITIAVVVSLLGGLYLKIAGVHDERGLLRDHSGYQHITNVSQINDFYPLTVSEIKTRSDYVQTVIPQELKLYLQQDPRNITKQEALYALDAFSNYYDTILSQIYLMSMVHPKKEVMTVAKEEIEKLEKISIDLFAMNRDLYLFLKTYSEEGMDRDLLLPEERYFLEETLKSYERNGLNLSDEAREKIGILKKELADLEMQFGLAIAQDATVIEVTAEELQGVPDDFIAGLAKNEKGLFVLRTDYPTQDMLLQQCSVESTRKKFYEAMMNKAYPANDSTLKAIINKRHVLAQSLGFRSFAHYDLSGQMAQNPKTVWNLYKELEPCIKSKANQEIKKICSDLPAGVRLTAQGKINAWDLGYTLNQYKKKNYQFDELVLAEYFPLRETIQGLFKIYEQFFSITLREIQPEKSWHEDVSVIEVSRDGMVLGYTFLDLHPRENKYNHGAMFSGLRTVRLLDGTLYPGVRTLVCNFTKPTENKPSLLGYTEVTTFFHEFGHAIHDILGITHLVSQAGTQVKRDFVELPSQMLELWMEDKAILKLVGKHYQTGKELPDDLIDKKLELLTLTNGYGELRQIMLGETALSLFEKGEHKDIYDIYNKYSKTLTPFINYIDNNHFLCSFGHLSGYGAKYYGYLWALIFAADVFEQIEKEGLLNPAAGKKYLDAILSKGGSKDPNELLFDYLGRKPNQKAFLKRNKFD